MGAITSHTNKMKMLQRQLSVVMTLLCCVHFHVQCCDEVEDAISRSDFPEEFLFGTSTSSYQIEGAPFEDGRGLSNWDVFSHTPGKIKNDENGDIADDHYHRYLEDIELMSSLGVNVYRFSISWTRILPRGIYGDINPNGIMFYNKIIDNLLLRGIEPFVTIHHHDLPQELEEKYGGWICLLMQRDFVHFAEICFKSFGDRVKYWTTINEPALVANYAYMKGIYAPGHCSPPFGNCNTGNSDVEPLIVVHNMLLAHAKAVELYRKHFQAKQGGTIGIVAHSVMYEPLRDEECDRQAVNRALAFLIPWVLDPLYPAEMRSILGSQLPVFSLKEKSLLKGSIDFIGINHYGSLYVKDCSLSACSLEADHPITGFVEITGIRDGVPIGDQTGFSWFFVVPRGMQKLVDYIMLKKQLRLVLTLLCCVHFHVQSSLGFEDGISRSQFPEGFLFGTCTSSYQIEGAPLEDGKGLSNWDVFSHIPGNINNDENGDIADDHYHRYLEDIELMSSLGINVYRFSISWARILPRGIYGDINPSGVMFYNKIIDNLLLRGIEPFVTIHHHDYPGELEERYGGWLSPLIQRDFVHFAEVCFKSFGDRVKYWATINEPNLFADMGFIRGTYPPGHCSPPFGNCNTGNSDVEPLIAVHNMILSHAKAVELYRKHFQAKQGGIIGIVTHTFMYEPLRDEECDRQAVKRALAFVVAWSLDPLYPPEMHSILGSQLPRFSPEEKSLIKGSIDFIGINNYGTLYAKDCSLTACPLGTDRPIRGFVEATGTRDGIPIGDLTGNPRFFVVPRGLEKIVDYIKIRYHNMPMYITENGYSSPHKPNVTMDDLLQDFKRIDYHKAYLAALLRAIRKGADVRGYMIWSLMDNFEWTSGYGVRYGLYYVDRHTLERIPKRSVQWFSSFLNDTSHSNKQDLSEQYVRSKDVTTAGFKVV
ncbi:Beta-glucosidase 18 [Glycine soja]